MNKRIKRKKVKLERSKIHDVLDLVLDVNGLEERTREKTGNKPTAFFEYAGHINTVTTALYLNGWHAMASVSERTDAWGIDESVVMLLKAKEKLYGQHR